MRRARWPAALLVALAAFAAAPRGAGRRRRGRSQPKTTLPDVEDEVMCPICGTALNLSASPQADRERAFIRRQIAAGKTKDQIEDELVAQYGTRVLAEPPKSGFDLTAWLVPGAAILLAAVAIALGLRRWRRAARDGGRITAGGRRAAARPRRRRAARRRPGALRPLRRGRRERPRRGLPYDHQERRRTTSGGFLQAGARGRPTSDSRHRDSA